MAKVLIKAGENPFIIEQVDILDGDGAVIGELDFSAPVIFTVEGSINALQCDASGLSDDAWIEIVSI